MKKIISCSSAAAALELESQSLIHLDDKQRRADYGIRIGHTQESLNEDEEYFVSYAPDGGYGWVVVIASFLSNIVIDGISLSFGVMQSAIQEASGRIVNNSTLSNTTIFLNGNSDEFEISVATYSLVGSIILSSQFLLGPLVAEMINTFGYKAVGMAGPIIASLGIFLSWACSSTVPNIWVLLVFYGLVTGIGFGMMYQIGIVIVGVYFEKRRSLATGIGVCGSGVGSVFFPILVNYMIQKNGWQGVFLLESGIVLFSTSFAFFYRPLPKKLVKKTALREKCMVDQKFTDDFLAKPADSLWKSPTFIIFCISVALTSLGFLTPYAFVPVKAVKELGMSEESGVFAVTMIGIVNIIGGVVFGYITDLQWVNKLVLNNTALTFGGLALCLVPFITEEYQLYLFVINFGLSITIYCLLRSVLLIHFFGVERISNCFGIMVLFMGITTLIGNPIGGWMKDYFGSYNYSFWAAGSYFLISSFLCYPLQRIRDWENNNNNQQPENSRKRKSLLVDSCLSFGS